MSRFAGAFPGYGVQGRMTRRLMAVVLLSQAPVVLFGAVAARALAEGTAANPGGYLTYGLLLAGLCVAASGLSRTPYGITLGWIVQCGTFLYGGALPMMFVMGLVFGALWLTALYQGRKMDQLTADYLARQQSDSTQDRPQ